MAIRWASDRIGDQGLVAFVTNGSWIDGNADSGLRACLADEFTSIHVVNLRGNQRTQGERSRREGGKGSDRYKVAKCIQAEPVFCSFWRSAHSKVIAVSVLRSSARALVLPSRSPFWSEIRIPVTRVAVFGITTLGTT